MKGFGTWLKNELNKNNISIEKLAKTLGVNRSTVHRWLKGETTPNVLQWNGIAYFLSLETNTKLENVLVDMSFAIMILE